MVQTLTSLETKKLQYDSIHRGKVRDIMRFDDILVMVATDRISAFDVPMPKGIPYKGQVLNEISAYFLRHARKVCPTWLLGEFNPHPNVSIGLYCEPIKVEMVIRGYLTGSAWRDIYEKGERDICGMVLPEGMREYAQFGGPIITPTTKEEKGHDLNISRDEIIGRGLATEQQYALMEQYTRGLFKLGQQMAKASGLILVDTKYEFGLYNGKVYLIDEANTPDSSRFWKEKSYKAFLESGTPPQQLSKEFVRQWLISKGFQGRSGDKMPELPDSFIEETSNRYIELYEILTRKKFVKSEIVMSDIENAIEKAINKEETAN